MRKSLDAIIVVLFVVIGVVVYISSNSIILSFLAAFGGALILGLILMGIMKEIQKKQNLNHSKKADKDEKYNVDRQIQNLMNLNSNQSINKKDLISAGARILCCDGIKDQYKIINCLGITENGGVLRSGFVAKNNLDPRIASKLHTDSYSTTKKASATKRAIAGGVLAGGVGAVVGAVSANEANANGGVVRTKNVHSNILYFMINDTIFSSYYVSKKVIEKYGKPKGIKNFSICEEENYYSITGPFSSATTIVEQDELRTLCDYFQRVIAGN